MENDPYPEMQNNNNKKQTNENNNNNNEVSIFVLGIRISLEPGHFPEVAKSIRFGGVLPVD